MQFEITFHEISDEYAEGLLPIWTDWEVTKYTLVRNIKTVEDCKNRLVRHKGWSLENDSLGPFVVKLNTKMVGYCGGTKGEDNRYEIFYHISRDEWRKGIGTQIADKLIHMAFEGKNANSVCASTVDKNIASWKILEKLNMIRIGTEKREATGDEILYKYKITRETYLDKKEMS